MVDQLEDVKHQTLIVRQNDGSMMAANGSEMTIQKFEIVIILLA